MNYAKKKGRIIVPIGVLVSDGCYLMRKRTAVTAYEPYVWEFPAGKEELGESDEDCIRRELIEELGFDFRKVPHQVVWGSTIVAPVFYLRVYVILVPSIIKYYLDGKWIPIEKSVEGSCTMVSSYKRTLNIIRRVCKHYNTLYPTNWRVSSIIDYKAEGLPTAIVTYENLANQDWCTISLNIDRTHLSKL